MKNCAVRSKIWIEDKGGNVVFGEGRYRILDAVARLQSLQAAAVELKMSYRALWGRIKASEARLNRPLVARAGRGSRLTPFASNLMTQYRELQQYIQQESDVFYANLLDSDSRTEETG